MGAISQLEDSNGNSSNHLDYISIEGTSARTRPFSYEEIMSRRKSKCVVAEPIKEEEPNQFKELPTKDEAVQALEYSSDVPEPKRMPEDPVQHSYNLKELKKEEALSDRNRRSSKTKHDVQMDAELRHYTEKSTRDRHASNAQQDDAEIRHYSEKSTRDRHAKNSRQGYHRQVSDQFEDEYEKEIYPKHHKDVLSKDMGMERGRRSERDIRRSQLTVNNVRIKSEIDKSGLARRNVRKLQEFQYSEKKGRRYEELEYTEKKGRRYEEEFAYPEKRGRRYEGFAYPEKKGRRYEEEFEYPEKKSRRHEEPKSKKRRSRSPEYRRTRQRSASVSPRERRMHKQKSPSISLKERRVHKQRSVSVSPRGRKHPTRRSPSVSPVARKRSHRRSASISPRGQNSHHGYSGHDFGEESSSLSFRERSGKESSETERIKASKNGGSIRHHGSGLGGYSPRKRKAEAATKISSPPPHSPERKVATWDQPPDSTIANNQLSTTKSNEFPSTPTSATPAKSQTEPPSHAPTMQLEISVDSIQLTQATRPKRRLYIENLPNSASDKAVIEWLNDFLRSSGLSHYHGNSPCISCIINKERCQAVVEFLTPEDATAALSLNDESFLGSILKVRRPKDFIDTATVVAEKAPDVTEVSHVVSDTVKNSSQKVFIGGISKAVTSGMLMEIVRSFGTLKAYQFEVNEFGEPYAFLEYLDPAVTNNACIGLNGMKLGGQVLTIVKAFPDSKLDEGHLESLPSNEIPLHAKPLLMKPTKVLKITNVFNMEEFMLLPVAELEETLEDARIECARFGTVKSINAVRRTSDSSIHASEQNPNAVPAEFETMDNPSETDTKTMADAVALDVQPMMDDTQGNPSVDGDNLEKEASNPPQVDATGNTFRNSSGDGDNLEKEINNPSQVDVTGNTFRNSSSDQDNLEKEINNPSQVDVASSALGNSNRDSDNLEKETRNPSQADVPSCTLENSSRDADNLEKENDNPSQVDVPCNTLENSSRDADNLEKENGNPSQVDVADKPSQVGVIDEEKPDASEAETPAENTQIPDMAEVEDHNPSEMGLASKEMKLESVEIESVELQTLSDTANVDKSHVSEEEKTVRASSDERAFEAGCILVEFMREEAACMAAHCLNGRPYDGRPVEVCYVAHDLYLEQFPR